MYFNCPFHPPAYRRFKNLYIRRIGFEFKKEDFIESKSRGAYSEKEFLYFIDKIHKKTDNFVIFYKFLTIFYIISWFFLIVLLFSSLEITKFYCILPFACILSFALCLMRAKNHYLRIMKTILEEENAVIVKESNIKWILGHSASFLQLIYIDDEKIPLNL